MKRRKKLKEHTAKHAQKRLAERFGMKWSELEIRQLTNRIRKGEFGQPVYQQSCSKAWYRIQSDMFVMLPRNLTVTTVYTKRMFEDFYAARVRQELIARIDPRLSDLELHYEANHSCSNARQL